MKSAKGMLKISVGTSNAPEFDVISLRSSKKFSEHNFVK
jgi:hypothetical protein